MRLSLLLLTLAVVGIGAAPTGSRAHIKQATRGDDLPLKGIKINIDPGHNGANAANAKKIAKLVDAGPIRKACDTVGAATRSGTGEAAITFAVALELKAELQRRGAVVELTRNNNSTWGPCINRRAMIGNRSEVSISIHGDGNLNPGARGFHVIKPTRLAGYTDDIAADSARLARAVRTGMDRTGIPRANYIGRDGLDARRDLGGLNLSNVPKVFVEMGNLRNSRDARALTRPAMQRRIAVVLADALSQYIASS